MDIRKLQQAIMLGLEDVKAQDIVIFDTEHLTALFERVIVASASSGRQTRALAVSVREAVRDAGFPVPRSEGEENAEWIIVDCGSAVVHVMQPSIRAYYRLEELWGEKPVSLQVQAGKKTRATSATTPKVVKKAAVKKTARKTAVKTTGTRVAADKPAASKTTEKKKPAVKKAVTTKVETVDKVSKPKTTAKKTPAVKKTATSAAKKPALKAPAVKKATATVAKKAASKAPAKAAVKKTAAKK